MRVLAGILTSMYGFPVGMGRPSGPIIVSCVVLKSLVLLYMLLFNKTEVECDSSMFKSPGSMTVKAEGFSIIRSFIPGNTTVPFVPAMENGWLNVVTVL